MEVIVSEAWKRGVERGQADVAHGRKRSVPEVRHGLGWRLGEVIAQATGLKMGEWW